MIKILIYYMYKSNNNLITQQPKPQKLPVSVSRKNSVNGILRTHNSIKYGPTLAKLAKNIENRTSESQKLNKIKAIIAENPNKISESLAKYGKLIKKLDPKYYKILKNKKRASGKSRKKRSIRKRYISRKNRK